LAKTQFKGKAPFFLPSQNLHKILYTTNSIINRDLAAFQTAESLEIALVNQKGFVSYYFLDGNPDWLRKLGEYRQLFKERLEEARTQIENQQQEQALYQIDLEWTEPLPLHRSGQYN